MHACMHAWHGLCITCPFDLRDVQLLRSKRVTKEEHARRVKIRRQAAQKSRDAVMERLLAALATAAEASGWPDADVSRVKKSFDMFESRGMPLGTRGGHLFPLEDMRTLSLAHVRMLCTCSYT